MSTNPYDEAEQAIYAALIHNFGPNDPAPPKGADMSTQTTDVTAWLDGLEEARKAATPGPWVSEIPGMIHANPVGRIKGGYLAHVEHAANAALIVAAVNALPEMVAALRGVLALAEELDGSAAECGAIARELYGAERPRLADSYGLKANAYADAAARLRAVMAAAHTEEARS